MSSIKRREGLAGSHSSPGCSPPIGPSIIAIAIPGLLAPSIGGVDLLPVIAIVVLGLPSPGVDGVNGVGAIVGVAGTSVVVVLGLPTAGGVIPGHSLAGIIVLGLPMAGAVFLGIPMAGVVVLSLPVAGAVVLSLPGAGVVVSIVIPLSTILTVLAVTGGGWWTWLRPALPQAGGGGRSLPFAE